MISNGIRVNLLNSTQETDLKVAAHLVSFYMLQYVLTIQWMYVGSAWNFNFNNNKTYSDQMRLFECKLCQEIQRHNKNKPFLSKCQVYFLLKCSLFLLEFLLLFLLFLFSSFAKTSRSVLHLLNLPDHAKASTVSKYSFYASDVHAVLKGTFLSTGNHFIRYIAR